MGRAPLGLSQTTTAQAERFVSVFSLLEARLRAAAPDLLFGAVVFAVFWLVAWTGQRLIAYAAPRVRADTGAVLLLSRVYYYGLLIFGLVTALGASGLNVSALVAGLGLTGFALGFALKDVLSNLVSGIMLLVYRPFNIGDRIKMGEFEGVIQTIRMRDTLVLADDGRQIVIPNTKLITEVVVNYGTSLPPAPTDQAPAARPAPAPAAAEDEFPAAGAADTTDAAPPTPDER
ncbi:MAG TPA: mechanosensitive ion channel domain-containing protein [Pyrinomonadaceae bacterium]|jgi:small-conductance mechanosensitive channel